MATLLGRAPDATHFDDWPLLPSKPNTLGEFCSRFVGHRQDAGQHIASGFRLASRFKKATAAMTFQPESGAIHAANRP
jgi:hypothetical protein